MSTGRRGRIELLEGTLDLLILQALRFGPAHGHTIMQLIQQGSDDVLRVGARIPISSASSFDQTRLDLFRAGHIREQSAGEVLPPYTERPQAAHDRNLEVADIRARDCAPPGSCMKWRSRDPIEHLDDDIQDHIRRETEENIARGMAPDEAAAAARLAFGNVALTREAVRAVWIPLWGDTCVQDVR